MRVLYALLFFAITSTFVQAQPNQVVPEVNHWRFQMNGQLPEQGRYDGHRGMRDRSEWFREYRPEMEWAQPEPNIFCYL